MSYWTGHHNRLISPDEQQLYDHLLQLSQIESPERLIERFRWLFIEGVSYPDSQIQAVVERLATAETAEAEFKFILNRCCHILINRWQIYRRLHGEIDELVNLFQRSPSSLTYSRSIRRLRELVRCFAQSEQYAILQRYANVLRQDLDSKGFQTKPLGTYIRRYPYLFEHCLLMEDSGSEHRQIVQQMKIRVQREFERDLSQYITYRLVRTASPQGQLAAATTNPTFLSDRDLILAVRRFAGKVDGRNTERDLARQFLIYSSHTRTYGDFKADLYRYLAGAVDPGYGRHQFYKSLTHYLRQTMPEHDHQPPNEFLAMRTYSKLFNFLVVDSPQQANHSVFLDLIMNVGTTVAIALLLKLVLLCQKVKPHLEKRFSVLFSHYEGHTKENGIGWLIDALEQLNIAFATNFGTVKLFGI